MSHGKEDTEQAKLVVCLAYAYVLWFTAAKQGRWLLLQHLETMQQDASATDVLILSLR